MSFPKQILLAATLLLSAVSRTAAAPVTSLDLLSRSTDEAGHFLETRGEDVYRRFREAGEGRSSGEIAKPKFPMKSKTAITKAKSPRKSTGIRKHKESTTRTKKASGKLGAKNLAIKKKHATTRKIAAHKAKGSRKSASEEYATRADSKKTRSRSGHRPDRGPERKGNAGDRTQGSSLRSMRNIKRNNDQRPVSPLSSNSVPGDPKPVSPPSTNAPSTKPPSSRPPNSRPPTPNPPSPRPPSTAPPSYSAPKPPPDLNKPLPPTPVRGIKKVINKVKSVVGLRKG
ncbi:unnamed protein product [Clonostachys solani]|uniref:Uncharacterized protein n=1 Tax=Clonostachys solani TaxID=160281 RepID=A0A9N9YYW2_9HYPO|nr:unnamed protein product [Clonostachys solani]